MKLKKAIEELEAGGQNVRFDRLLTILDAFFGPPRQKGSHHIYATGLTDIPQVNLQRRRDGKTKPYQTKEALAALRHLAEANPELMTGE